MATDDDSDYVCTLDQASIKKAKDELNENPQDRLSAVQALREWIQAQPHINMHSTDTNTLLKFLRGCKFSQVRAREMIESYLQLKKKMPDSFLNVDTHDPKVLAFLSEGMMVPLPKRTKDGCLIVLTRLEKFNLKFEMKAFLKSITILMEYISRSEMTQVNGTIFIDDYTGVKAKGIGKTMHKDLAHLQKEWMKTVPGRYKAFHEYNVGVIFETILAFFRPFTPQKWLDRIKVHSTMESVFEYIPMELLPMEYLPDEYTGPNIGTCDELAKKFLADVKEDSFRQYLLNLTSPQFGVDLSKKPEQTVTQHFRKLNVD